MDLSRKQFRYENIRAFTYWTVFSLLQCDDAHFGIPVLSFFGGGLFAGMMRAIKAVA